MPVINHTKEILHNNISLASTFHKMANGYRFLGKNERFRALAYDNVARILLNMKEDIVQYAKDVKTLDAIGGIGESIAEKIIEYLHTGKIKTFEKLKKQVPFELLELMDISSMGPATLKTLHDELHIKNKDELIAAIESGRLNTLKGFGNKKIENISKSLKLIKAPQRLPLQEAKKFAEELIVEIRKIAGVQKAEIAGSLRRKKETIGDIDIIILAEIKNRKKIVARFISLPQVKKVLAKGLTKASVILKYKNVQVDIRLVHDYEYGAAMLYFTGSKEHNIKLRTIAKQRGLKINEYGIFDAATNELLAGRTEEEMYHFLHLRYILPEQRLDKGEIEKAVIK